MKTCPSCRIGRLGSRSMAYIEWHGDNLLIANRMPVQVCDICGERLYDDEALENLHRLLWAGLPPVDRAVSGRNT